MKTRLTSYLTLIVIVSLFFNAMFNIIIGKKDVTLDEGKNSFPEDPDDRKVKRDFEFLSESNEFSDSNSDDEDSDDETIEAKDFSKFRKVSRSEIVSLPSLCFLFKHPNFPSYYSLVVFTVSRRSWPFYQNNTGKTSHPVMIPRTVLPRRNSASSKPGRPRQRKKPLGPGTFAIIR